MLLAAGFQSSDAAIGYILTGLIIGRGSNYLHQFIDQFFPTKKAPGPPAPSR